MNTLLTKQELDMVKAWGAGPAEIEMATAAGFAPEVVGGGAIQWTKSMPDGSRALLCNAQGGVGGDVAAAIWIGETSEADGNPIDQIAGVPLVEALAWIQKPGSPHPT